VLEELAGRVDGFSVAEVVECDGKAPGSSTPMTGSILGAYRGPAHFTWSAPHYPMGVGVEVHVLAAKKPHEC
jgi:hypothetical protein